MIHSEKVDLIEVESRIVSGFQRLGEYGGGETLVSGYNVTVRRNKFWCSVAQ